MWYSKTQVYKLSLPVSYWNVICYPYSSAVQLEVCKIPTHAPRWPLLLPNKHWTWTCIAKELEPFSTNKFKFKEPDRGIRYVRCYSFDGVFQRTTNVISFFLRNLVMTGWRIRSQWHPESKPDDPQRSKHVKHRGPSAVKSMLAEDSWYRQGNNCTKLGSCIDI